MKTIKDFKTKFPRDSAGRRMVENVPICHIENNISDIRKMLLERANEFETINYIYVVDKEGKLTGAFSIKEIFQRPVETKIEDLMTREIIKVHSHTDQEKVAVLALKHNVKAVPVVDRENKFLGIVPSDTILEILHREHLEDISHFTGIHNGVYFPSKVIKVPVGVLAKARIPWLIVGLFGGILAAQIANFFETPLKAHFILVSFIPLIVYIAAAVGSQTQTLIIRNLALDLEFSFKRYFSKEIRVSFIIALILGVILSLISLLWYQLPYLGLILGTSIFLTITAAVCIGALIPYFLQKFKQDPAIWFGSFLHHNHGLRFLNYLFFGCFFIA